MRIEIRATDADTLEGHIKNLSKYEPHQETISIKEPWSDESEDKEIYTIEINTLDDLKDLQKICTDNRSKGEWEPILIIDFIGIGNDFDEDRPHIEIYNDWRE